MISDRDVLKAVRVNFPLFALKAFHILNPSQTLSPTPAFLAVAHKLGEAARGRVRRLIINVPPRSAKSLLCSVALPSYVLGQDPSRRIICASYSQELSSKFGRDTRLLLQHPLYRRLFPGTVIVGKNTETELETAHGGFRYATSVGGTLTGRGGNLIIIDDPQKPDQAMSKVARDNTWDWFTQTVGSRLDNKAEDVIVVVMQRLHQDDLTGRLLQLDGWEVLNIPAIAEREQHLVIAPGRVLIRKPDDVLDEIREPRQVLDNLRQELGSATFSAQYQQQPVPPDGALIKRAWLVFYDQPPEGDWIVQSWDTANKPGEQNDYSVCTTWVVKNQDAFLLDVWRARVDFPSLLKMAAELRQRHRAAVTLIEDAGSGTSLIQALSEKGIHATAMKPTADKITRLSTASALIEGGRVRFPSKALWLDDFTAELLAFPGGTHDDMVDSVSQFIDWHQYRHRNAVGTMRKRGL